MSRRPSLRSLASLSQHVIGHPSSIHLRRGWQLAVVAALCFALPAGAFDGGGTPAMKVEEDWEIVVGEPSDEEVLPQLYVVTTPTGALDGQYSVFEINNLLLPDFYGGGLQFQTWDGDLPTGEAHHSDFAALTTPGETITFTVSMKIEGSLLRFRVKSGQSTTWGTFGAGNELTIWQDSQVNDLSGYNPEKSAKFSRVGSGRNRVTSFKLKQVRYYDGNNNLLSTDQTVHDAQIDEPT